MNIDPSMGEFIDQMLKRYDYDPQAYRSCSLVLGKYVTLAINFLMTQHKSRAWQDIGLCI